MQIAEKLGRQRFAFFYLLIAFFITQNADAQIFKPKNHALPSQTHSMSAERDEPRTGTQLPSTNWYNSWHLTLTGGLTYQVGNVREYRFYEVFRNIKDWRYGGSLIFERDLSPVFSLRGQGVFETFAGHSPSLDRSFTSNNLEGTLNTAIDLNNLFGRNRKDRFFSIHLIFGAGLANYSTTLTEISTGNVVKKSGYGNGAGIGGRLLDALVLAGVGADFRLNDHWKLQLETASRMLNSDLLDLTTGGRKFDVYNFTSAGLSYSFGKSRTYSKVPETTAIEPVTVIREPVQPAAPSLNQVIEPLIIEQIIQEPEPELVTIIDSVKMETVEKVDLKPSIEYRVQIRARYEGKVPIVDLSRKYNIPEHEIVESTHNHYYIYTVGSFDTYEAAAEKRNSIRSVNKVYDAFVVVFQKGERVDKIKK